MKIKTFYLDLREWPQYWKKDGNVWLLESEAFKEPLKFVFEFENEDLREIQNIEESCKSYYNKLIETEKRLDEKIEEIKKYKETLQNKYNEISDYFSENSKKTVKFEEIIQENKDIFHWFTEALFKQDQKLTDLKEEVKKPKPSKIYQFNQKWLAIWNDEIFGDAIELPKWKYLIIEKKTFTPGNEFVDWEDEELTFCVQYLDGEYIPKVKLISTNWIDKPVCEVEINVLFFQI